MNLKASSPLTLPFPLHYTFLSHLFLNVVIQPFLLSQGLEVTSQHTTWEAAASSSLNITLLQKEPFLGVQVTSWTNKTNIQQDKKASITNAIENRSNGTMAAYVDSDYKSRKFMKPTTELPFLLTPPRQEDEILDDGDRDIPNCGYDATGCIKATGAGDYTITSTKDKDTNNSRLTPTIEASQQESSEISSHSRVRRQTITLHGPLWTKPDTLFVELSAIGDYGFCKKHGGYAEERIAQIVGVANMIFEPLGVVVVLSDVQLWYYGDEVDVSQAKETTLIKMKDFRAKMAKENPDKVNDNLMLITTGLSEFDGGLAQTGGICDDYQSVNIVQDVDQNVTIVGLFLAHELGHNLNMKHDGDSRGKYFDGIGRCENNEDYIMKPVVSYDRKLHWSECSKRYLEELREMEKVRCLKNVPKETYRSTCGNGIVEYGEECDCGIPELCKNPCCDPKTCRLAPHAQCASGTCCDTATCRPRPAGTTCRSASNECDLPEFCSGSSESCPDDVHKGDGVSCRYAQGYCYQGKCGAHSDRCRTLFGDQATVAQSTCFKSYFNWTDKNGNCGQNFPNTKKYKSCDTDSYMCGTLYCDNRGYTEIKLKGGNTFYPNMKYAGSSRCQYLEGHIHLYPEEYWLTPNGASCGDRKMCINQKCSQISGTDDSLRCPNKCSGRGVCNSKGNCHCDPGYSPPDCSQPGSGGSYDSESPGEGPPTMIAVVVILMLLLMLLILLIIMCCLWDKIRGWWEITGRSKITPLAPKAALCIDNCLCSTMSKGIQWMVLHGPLQKQKNLSSSPDTGVSRKKPTGYKVDVKIKRDSYNDPENPKHKPLLPPSSLTLHHNSFEKISRPKYGNQISVDSGCIIEDDETPSTNISMSSLISEFKNYGSKSENDRMCSQDHHKEVSLRRLVTDPHSGHRNSNHSLPYQKPPNSRHSFSTDVSMNNKVANGTEIPAYSVKSNANRLSGNSFISSDKFNKKDRGLPGIHIHQPNAKKPILPPQRAMTPPRVIPSRANTPPRATPPRDPPPRPPTKEANKMHLSKSTERIFDNKVQGINGKEYSAMPKTNSHGKTLATENKGETVKLNIHGKKNVRSIAQKFENA